MRFFTSSSRRALARSLWTQSVRGPDPQRRTLRSFARPLLFTTCTSAACFAAAGSTHHLPGLLKPPSWARDIRWKLEGMGVSPRFFSATGAIVCANVAVFALWKVSPGARVLRRLFLQTPTENRSLPLLFSTFSHNQPLHLAFNMFAFWSFSAPVAAVIGSANTLALYISAGVTSGFLSTVVRNVIPTLRSSTMVPSLGASGAVWGLIAFVGCQFPEAKMSIIFLPMIYAPAYQMVLGLAAVDACGVFLGWRFFDHAAHLGGLAFGATFYWMLKNTKWVQKYQKYSRHMFLRARRYYLNKLKNI